MALLGPRTGRFTPFAVALGFLVLTSFIQAGCTKVPLVAPSGTVINLISTTNMLPINGSADIVAVLVENGTTSTGTGTGGGTGTTTTTPSTGNPVHNGTLVSFSTTLGRIEPAEAKTSNGGQVTVKLIADGRSGVATITAYSGGASKTLTVNIGAAAAARVLVSATPQTLPANGGTATVTASVQDQQGNGIGGVPVTFSTSKGTLGATTVVTNDAGLATTTVTTTADATVTASAGGSGTATLQGTVALTIASRGTVTITGPSGTVTVGVPTTFQVTVGTGVAAANVNVDFGDGDVAKLGAVTGSTTVGHVYQRAGRTYTAAVNAEFVDGTTSTQQTQVVVADYDFSLNCGSGTVSFENAGTSTLTVTLNPSTLSIQDVLWEFGSGEGSQVSGTSTTHSWQSRGTKVVTATVRPTFASAKSKTCTVEVK